MPLAPLGLFLCVCQGEIMTGTINKKSYLEQLLELSHSMLAALRADDIDMASQLYEERERFLATNVPDETTAPETLLNQVLECDQRVIAAAQAKRVQMLDSAIKLNTVRSYSSGLPRKADGGDWGSG